jgi:hypothetical protein
VGDVAQLDVAVRGSGSQDVEGLIGGAPVLGHDDAQRLIDDAAGSQGGFEVAGEFDLVG